MSAKGQGIFAATGFFTALFCAAIVFTLSVNVPISFSAEGSCGNEAKISPDCSGTQYCPTYQYKGAPYLTDACVPPQAGQQATKDGLIGKSCSVKDINLYTGGKCCALTKCANPTHQDGKELKKTPEQLQKEVNTGAYTPKLEQPAGAPPPVKTGTVENPIKGDEKTAEKNWYDVWDYQGWKEAVEKGVEKTVNTFQELAGYGVDEQEGLNLGTLTKDPDTGLLKGGTDLQAPSGTKDGLGVSQDDEMFNPKYTGFGGPDGMAEEQDKSWMDYLKEGAKQTAEAAQKLADYLKGPETMTDENPDLPIAGKEYAALPKDTSPTVSPEEVPESAWKGGSSPYLADQRAKLMAELDTNPELRERIAAVIGREMGNKDGGQAVLESMVNRAIQRGYTSLDQALNDGFYGPVNRGEVDAYIKSGVSAADKAVAEYAIQAVKSGSNICDFCTDQGQKWEVKGPKWEIGTEWFGHMNGSDKWAKQQMGLQTAYDTNFQAGKPAVADTGNPLWGIPSSELQSFAKSWNSYQPATADAFKGSTYADMSGYDFNPPVEAPSPSVTADSSFSAPTSVPHDQYGMDDFDYESPPWAYYANVDDIQAGASVDTLKSDDDWFDPGTAGDKIAGAVDTVVDEAAEWWKDNYQKYVDSGKIVSPPAETVAKDGPDDNVEIVKVTPVKVGETSATRGLPGPAAKIDTDVTGVKTVQTIPIGPESDASTKWWNDNYQKYVDSGKISGASGDWEAGVDWNEYYGVKTGDDLVRQKLAEADKLIAENATYIEKMDAYINDVYGKLGLSTPDDAAFSDIAPEYLQPKTPEQKVADVGSDVFGNVDEDKGAVERAWDKIAKNLSKAASDVGGWVGYYEEGGQDPKAFGDAGEVPVSTGKDIEGTDKDIHVLAHEGGGALAEPTEQEKAWDEYIQSLNKVAQEEKILENERWEQAMKELSGFGQTTDVDSGAKKDSPQPSVAELERARLEEAFKKTPGMTATNLTEFAKAHQVPLLDFDSREDLWDSRGLADKYGDYNGTAAQNDRLLKELQAGALASTQKSLDESAKAPPAAVSRAISFEKGEHPPQVPTINWDANDESVLEYQDYLEKQNYAKTWEAEKDLSFDTEPKKYPTVPTDDTTVTYAADKYEGKQTVEELEKKVEALRADVQGQEDRLKSAYRVDDINKIPPVATEKGLLPLKMQTDYLAATEKLAGLEVEETSAKIAKLEADTAEGFLPGQQEQYTNLEKELKSREDKLDQIIASRNETQKQLEDTLRQTMKPQSLEDIQKAIQHERNFLDSTDPKIGEIKAQISKLEADTAEGFLPGQQEKYTELTKELSQLRKSIGTEERSLDLLSKASQWRLSTLEKWEAEAKDGSFEYAKAPVEKTWADTFKDATSWVGSWFGQSGDAIAADVSGAKSGDLSQDKSVDYFTGDFEGFGETTAGLTEEEAASIKKTVDAQDMAALEEKAGTGESGTENIDGESTDTASKDEKKGDTEEVSGPDTDAERAEEEKRAAEKEKAREEALQAEEEAMQKKAGEAYDKQKELQKAADDAAARAKTEEQKWKAEQQKMTSARKQFENDLSKARSDLARGRRAASIAESTGDEGKIRAAVDDLDTGNLRKLANSSVVDAGDKSALQTYANRIDAAGGKMEEILECEECSRTPLKGLSNTAIGNAQKAIDLSKGILDYTKTPAWFQTDQAQLAAQTAAQAKQLQVQATTAARAAEVYFMREPVWMGTTVLQAPWSGASVLYGYYGVW